MSLSRPLGYLETVYHLMHDTCMGVGITTVAVELKGELNVEKLLSALARLHEGTIFLQARIVQEEDLRFYFDVPFSAIPIKITQDITEEFYLSTLDNELQTCFIADQFLWRAHVLKGEQDKHYFIISAHHSISDGLSLNKCIENLFVQYHQDSNLFLQRETFPDPVEKLLVNQCSVQAYQQYYASLDQDILKSWCFSQVVSLEKQVTRNVYFNFDKEKTEKIKKYCKVFSIRPNALFNAVALKSLGNKTEMINMNLHTPVNLRQLCHPVVNEAILGCYIGIAKTQHFEISENTDVVELAFDYQKKLNHFLSGMPFFPKEWSKASLENLFNKKEINERIHYVGGLAISQLGRISISPVQDQLYIKDIYFTGSLLGGFGVGVFYVLEFNNHYNITYTYTDPLEQDEKALAYIERFKQLMLKLIE